MRHYKKGRKLGTDASHTKAMKKSLVAAILENDRIKTTEARAKEIRPDVDQMITWAKRGDIHSRRLAIAKVGDKELVRELFEKVQQGMFKDRPGGYTRIIKLGSRKGDKAPIVIMELVTEPVKSAAAPATKKATPKKVSSKKDEEAADEAISEEKAEEAVEALNAEEETEQAQDAAEEVRTAEADGDVAVEAEEKAEEAEAALEASEDAAAAEDAAAEVVSEKAEEKAE